MARPNLVSSYLDRQDKWNPGFFRMEIDQLKATIPTTSFVVEPHNSREGDFNVSVVVDYSQYSGGEARMASTLETLVANSGIEGLELERSYHGDSYSVKLTTTDPTDLTRITKALTQDVELEHGASIDGIIEPEVSRAVADELRKVIDGLEVNDLEEGLKSVPYLTEIDGFSSQIYTSGYEGDPEGQREYLTVRSDIPDATIESIGRDGRHVANKDGESALMEITELTFPEGARKAISTALQAAGFKSVIADDHATIEGPLKDVAQAFADRGILGQGMNDAIQSEVASLSNAFISSAEVATLEDSAGHSATRRLAKITSPVNA